MGTLLLFAEGKLIMEVKSVDSIHDKADAIRANGEEFYIYSNNSYDWYKGYRNCTEEEVPAVYRTLKLMLTN
jgi:hypothetical protein